MSVTEYWKEIGGVLALILIISGVGTYTLVKSDSSDICTSGGVRDSWRPTLIPYRYICEKEFTNAKPKVLWCSELSDYGGTPKAKCSIMKQVAFSSPDLGRGELTGYDLIKFEEYPVSWKCSQPLVELIDSRTKEVFMGCNASLVPDQTTVNKPVLARELAPEGLTYAELNQKVGGFNHYKYAFTTFEVCNPFSKSEDLVSSLGAVFPDLQVKDYRLLKESNGRWYYYAPSSLILEPTKCERFGITIQKLNSRDTIEYGTKVSRGGVDYVNHPFWDGATGDQSHVMLVPDNKYVVEDWENYDVGAINPLPWVNDTDCETACAGFSPFTIYNEGGNKIINMTHPGPDTGAGGSLFLKHPSVGNMGENFTMYAKFNYWEGSSDYSTPGVQYKESANYDRVYVGNTWDRATKWGGFYSAGGVAEGVSVTFQNTFDTWYFTAFNQTMNASDDGALLWAGITTAGDGVWNWTNTTSDYAAYGVADKLNLMLSVYTAPVNSKWDNLFIAQVPDKNYLYSSITNLSCPFLYSDAGNTPIANQTIFFYRNNILDTTLFNPSPNSSNRGWTKNVTSYDVGLWSCNATVCDTGGECDSTPKSNSLEITGGLEDQFHITLVPDSKFWVEDWQDYSAGRVNPSPYTNITADPDLSPFKISASGENKFINATTTGAVGLSSLDLATLPNFGGNFTVYFKANHLTQGTGWGFNGYRWTAGTGEDDELVRQFDGGSKIGYLYATGGAELSLVADQIFNAWYYFAMNATKNATDDGTNYWAGVGSGGDGLWGVVTNSSLNHGSVDTHNRSRIIVTSSAGGYNFAWDNLFSVTIPDKDLPDTISNLSCPFLYDKQGITLANYTVRFYKDGILDTTLVNPAPNSTNRGWTINISSANVGSWHCNATVYGSDGNFDVTPNSNSISIYQTNTAPVINYVQAQMNSTTVYKSPELFHWLDNMTALRVNCTDPDASQPINVHVNLTDRKNLLRCDGDAVQSGDLWTYICPSNETINRSSTWTFRASCTDGIAATQLNVTRWTIPWGSLSITMTTPTANINVRQNTTFSWSGYATCSDGECINVSHALDPIIARELEGFIPDYVR